MRITTLETLHLPSSGYEFDEDGAPSEGGEQQVLGAAQGADRNGTETASGEGARHEEEEGEEEGEEEEVLDDEALARRLQEEEQRSLYERMLEMSGYHAHQGPRHG